MFIVIWEYAIKEDNYDRFVETYKTNGIWSRFFKQSNQYLNSHLIEKDRTNFLLLDIWRSREAYCSFIKHNESKYIELSHQFATLYKDERKLGEIEE